MPESDIGHICKKDVIDMRRTLGILLAVVLVFTLASCSNDVAPLGEGTLVINIGGGQEKGVQPAISMNTASYALTVTNSLDTNVIETTLHSNTHSVDYKLPAGAYVVKLDAMNSSGDVIGTGSESVTVVPGETNTVTVTVREASGNGTFAVSIIANEGYGLRLKVYNILDEVMYSRNLVYSDGKYTTDGEVVLANGFYRFEIKRTDTNAVVKADSLRIVKDMTSGYSARFSFTTDGGITIVNEVLSIPVITITLNKEVLTADETLVAQAQISGIDDYEVLWYLDGTASGNGFGAYSDFEMPLEGKDSGTHEVTLYVKNSSVIWSESRYFSIGNGAGRSLSLSNLAAGGSIELSGISADTELELSGFSLEDGVYIEVVGDNSRDISRGFGDVSDFMSNLFRRENGTYIPVPDKDGCAEFVAGAIGVVRDAKVIIHKLDKLDFDYEIRGDEYPGLNGLAEEYYYISFLSPEYRMLDPGEIVLVESGTVGAQGVSVLQRGMLNRDSRGVFDFSGQWFTGFAVNMHRVMNNHDTNVMRLNILNPLHAELDSPTAIDSELSVIRVDRKDSGEYKVVVTFSGDNTSEVIRKIALNYDGLALHPRGTDGINRDLMVFPEYDLENRTITYHLGRLDEDLLFTLNYDSANTGFVEGEASLVLEEDPEGYDIFDLTELENSVDITAPSNGIVTWAYKAEEKVLFEIIDNNSHRYRSSFYVVSRSGEGSSGMAKGEYECEGTGFIIVDYTGNDTNVSLLTLRNTVHQGIDCSSVEWDPDKKEYFCADENCESCAALGSRQSYDGGFIHLNWESISSDTFWTEDEFEDYGRIGFGLGGSVYASNEFFDTSTTGNVRPDDPYGTLAWKHDDTDRRVEIRLRKILVFENKIVCDIALNGSDEFTTGVVMTPRKSVSEIRIEGTPVAQYAETACNPEGLIVTAYYSDGTTADVTALAEFKTENGSDNWGEIISYSDGRWRPDNSYHRIYAYYGEDGSTWRARSLAFMLHPQKGENTHETAYELPYGEESYIVMDSSGFNGNHASPIIIDGDNISGYLLEGASADEDAVMVFTYDQYKDNSCVDFNTFYGMMAQYGVWTDDSETLPAFNWYSSNGQTRMIVCSFSGQGDPFELVVVYGRLQNDIDPATGISMADFDGSTTKSFFIKTVSL